jgi:hypothetical protein
MLALSTIQRVCFQNNVPAEVAEPFVLGVDLFPFAGELGLCGRFVTLFLESWGVVVEESLALMDLSLVRLGDMVCGEVVDVGRWCMVGI